MATCSPESPRDARRFHDGVEREALLATDSESLTMILSALSESGLRTP